MQTLLQDIRYGARLLMKNPGFTLVALLALALGIGANTAIFSVINAVLLRPLSYAEPERLVIFWERTPQMDTSVAYLNYVDWRDRNSVFDSLMAARRESFNLTGAGEAERLGGRMVSASFFKTFGVPPARGRDFVESDDRPEAAPTVILAHGFWQRRFGGDEGILNQTITLDGRSFTVIGIAAADFSYGATVDLFVPIGLWANDYQERGMHPGIYLVGRLKSGVSIEQAKSDLDAIMAALGEQFPDSNRDRSTRITSLYENTVEESRSMLLMLVGAVAFVLLIACANVANLLLARAATRQKEIALRTVLGAGRLRIMRQLLTESVLLALGGGALGLLFAVWSKDALLSFLPEGVPRLQEVSLDAGVLLFTALTALVTGVLFGLIPALQASKPQLSDVLKDSERGTTGQRHRVRNGLVIAEVALAFVLLIGAGLMARSFWQLQQLERGFDSQNVLTMQFGMQLRPPASQPTGGNPADAADAGNQADDETSKQAKAYLSQLEEKIAALPGVQSLAISNGLPFLGAPENSFYVEGDDNRNVEHSKMGVWFVTTSDYQKTLGIRLLRGRFFDERDTAGSKRVAVIDEKFANLYYPDQDPVGRQILGPSGTPNLEIIGVVANVKHYGLEGEVPVQAQYYFALAQAPPMYLRHLVQRLVLTVKTEGEATALAAAVRAEILSLNREQPVFNIRTLDEIINESLAARRFSLALLVVFAVVALLLAGVGIYGVMAYSVTQRTHEIGIRMALGAQSRDVLRLVVGQGMKLVAAGLGIGIAAAFALTKLLASQLFAVSAADPLTYGAITLLLGGVAFLANYLPAYRASKVDPMVALRYE